ncbi:hypothetical protein AOLI_G00116610 [Acnodon oligacanthus]
MCRCPHSSQGVRYFHPQKREELKNCNAMVISVQPDRSERSGESPAVISAWLKSLPRCHFIDVTLCNAPRCSRANESHFIMMEPLATSRPCLQVNYFNISGGYNLLTPTMPEHNVIALFNQLDSSWSSGSPRSPADRNVKL